MIPIYIIEDEPPAAEKLRLFLQRAEPESAISVFHDGVIALAALRAARPEIVFLDIEMPGLTGIELLEQLPPEERPQIIITSAYEKYALSGFRFNVTDYLLKPYSYAQLVEALGKAKEALRLQALDRRVQGGATSEVQEATLTIRTDLRTERIEVDRIIYVEAVKDYVRIVVNGRRLLTQQTLTSIEAQLPADRFCRIHRSYLINTTQVKAYDRDSVTLSDGTALTVGKTYKAKFNEIAKSIFKTGRK